jgi:hypothetical protein
VKLEARSCGKAVKLRAHGLPEWLRIVEGASGSIRLNPAKPALEDWLIRIDLQPRSWRNRDFLG